MFLSFTHTHTHTHTRMRTHTHTQVVNAFLKQLLDKIKEDINTLDDSEEASQIQQHFENTLQHVRHTRANDSSMYEGLEV